MTTTPTVLTSRTGADFLAMLPTLAGFAPHDSVLIVPFHGRRTMGVVRMDLPTPADSDDHDRFCSVAVGAVSRLNLCDGVAIAVYTDETFAVAYAGWESLISRMQARLEEAGFAVKDLLCAAPDGWASWCEPDPPWDGHPLQQIADSPLAEQAARARGGLTLPAHDAAPPAPVDPQIRARLSEAVGLHAVTGRSRDAFGVARPGRRPRSADVAPQLVRCTDAAAMPFALMAAAATLSLDPVERDESLIHVAFGGKTARRARTDIRRLWERGGGAATTVGGDARGSSGGGERRPEAYRLLTGASRRLPDVHAMLGVLPLLDRVVSHLDRPLRADLLYMSAWLHWACGSGTHAGRCVDEALAIDPAHGPSAALRGWVGSGTLPDWVYAHHDAGARHRG